MKCEIGVDLIEVERIRSLRERWGSRFEERIFTPAEREYCARKHDPMQSLAARFAAKEAVFKALGTGWNFGMRWQEIEILNDHYGKPEVRLTGAVLEYAIRKNMACIQISLSHTEHYAVAFVQMYFAEK